MSMVGEADAPAQGLASEVVVAIVTSDVHGLGCIVSIVSHCCFKDALSGGLREVRSRQE